MPCRKNGRKFLDTCGKNDFKFPANITQNFCGKKRKKIHLYRLMFKDMTQETVISLLAAA